jgi:hypothetical protein
MDAVLSRTYGQRQTTGCLYVFDGDRAVLNVRTLELPQLGNAQNISCYPAGTYWVIKHKRPSGKWCFWVQDVPNRTAILWHAGTYAAGVKKDTQGCTLVGLRYVDVNADGNLDIVDSQKALDMLLAVLPDRFRFYVL